MLSVTQLLFQPVVSIKRRFGGRIKAASLNAPPPPIETRNEWKFGPYSWKAIVESRDKNGEVDRTFIGYSPDMNITMKTQVACDRYKREGTECGEVNLVMKGGDSKEVILMKKKDSDVLLPITMY
jgi:hypothetical protein|tara:strand:+ start:876 stop:1250 length:375 start_codon:yes stop_codon:yes gene_type:complete